MSSDFTCYYYDVENNSCRCYVNKNLDNLLADNASLIVKLNVEHIVRQNAEVENTKLRELVRKIEHYERMGCYECSYSCNCDVDTLYDEGCAMSCEIERDKCELGVNING